MEYAEREMLSVDLKDSVMDIYFRFIQFSLGVYEGKEFLDGSALKGFDWNAFYEFAKKQTLIGVVFDGIQKLPKEVAPPLDLLMRWFGGSRKIKMRNEVMNRATVAICNKVKGAGYSCCVLKGQGNAVMYPNPSSRISGDVDVWVNAGREEIRSLAHSLTENANGHVDDESLNHIGLTINGITVELHSTPGFMANFVYNRRLQKWLKRDVDLQCCNMVALPNDAGIVAAPTLSFNIVYQLYHLYHHYFYEGVGLRQVVDYYFVLVKSEERRVKNLTALQHELKYLGLWKFAGAAMYVLRKVMGLAEDKMIALMDAKRGQMLLEDILNGGNFGHYDQLHVLGHNLLRIYRDARLLRFYPTEALSEPIFRAWHWWWRKNNSGIYDKRDLKNGSPAKACGLSIDSRKSK